MRKPDWDEKILVKLITGQRVELPRKELVGCCHSKTHPGKLTEALMDAHECLAKNCGSFEKYGNTPYWKGRAKRQAKKDPKTVKRENKLLKRRGKELLEARREALLRDARALAAEREEALDVVDVRFVPNSRYTVFYVSDQPRSDWLLFREFHAALAERNPGKHIRLQHVVGLDGEYLTREEFYRLKAVLK